MADLLRKKNRAMRSFLMVRIIMTRAKRYSWKMTQMTAAQEKTARTLYQITKARADLKIRAALKAEKHLQKQRKRLRETTALS